MANCIRKKPFDVEPDANKFDAETLDTEGLKSLVASIIFFATQDLAMELYKRRLGVKHHLIDRHLASAVRFFRSHRFDDYAQFIRFGLTGEEIIKMISNDPGKYLELHSKAAAERIFREENEDIEKYGAFLDSEHMTIPEGGEA